MVSAWYSVVTTLVHRMAQELRPQVVLSTELLRNLLTYQVDSSRVCQSVVFDNWMICTSVSSCLPLAMHAVWLGQWKVEFWLRVCTQRINAMLDDYGMSFKIWHGCLAGISRLLTRIVNMSSPDMSDLHNLLGTSALW